LVGERERVNTSSNGSFLKVSLDIYIVNVKEKLFLGFALFISMRG
jgi:hypothetical protein